MTVLDRLVYKSSGKDLSKDLGDAAYSLKESAKQMASSLKQTYETKVRPSITGGVEGAGLTGASFLNQLGLTGLAGSYKERREQEELNRMGIYGPSTASKDGKENSSEAVAETEKAIKSEKEDEANAIRQEQLEIQKKTSDDLMALYTITDDYQKKMLERTKEMVDSLKVIADKPAGGGGGLLDTAADLAGSFGKGGGTAAKGGGLLSKAGGLLKAAGPGLLKGGLIGIGGAAAEAGGDALKEAGYEKTGGAVSTLGSAAKYAGMGAMVGSVIPGLGTAIGGAVGGVIGAGVGLYKNWGSMFGGSKNEAKDIKEENATQEIQFDEAAFAQKDPENYAKFKEFEQKKIEELRAKDPFSKNPDARNQQMVRRKAESDARREAINKFKKEIEAVGAGSVKGQALQKNDQTVEQQQNQKTGDAVTKNNTEQKAMTAASPDSGIGNKTVEQLAMDEAKKYGRSTPDAQDRRAAEMAFRKQALGGKSEGELSGVSTLPTTTATRVSTLPTTTATPAPAATSASPDSGIGNKTVEQLAMEEAKRFGRSTPIQQDRDAAAMAYRKQAAGGAAEANLSGVSTLPPSKADDVANKTASLKDQETAGTNTAQPAPAPVINNTSVVSNKNNETTKPKDTRNNETTFQKYMDRRYYPV